MGRVAERVNWIGGMRLKRELGRLLEGRESWRGGGLFGGFVVAIGILVERFVGRRSRGGLMR